MLKPSTALHAICQAPICQALEQTRSIDCLALLIAWRSRLMCHSVSAACRDRDGKFQLKELLDFAQYVHDMSSDLQLYELQSAVHGTCMLDLWRGINTEPGMSAIVQWCACISPIEPLSRY